MLSFRNIERRLAVPFIAFTILAVAFIEPVLAKEASAYSENGQAYAKVVGHPHPSGAYFDQAYHEGWVGQNAGCDAYTKFKGYGGPGQDYCIEYPLDPNQRTSRDFYNIAECWLLTHTDADYGGADGIVEVVIYQGPIGP